MIDKNRLKQYTNTKRCSKLLPYKENIKYLLDNNASQVAIIRYLDEQENLSVTRPTLSDFIKKHINKKPFTPKEKKSPTNSEEKKPKLRSSVFDD